MALVDVIKNLGTGLSEDVKELKSILRRIRLNADSSAIGANFRKFGHSFATYDFDAFVDKAKLFFHEAMDSTDTHYTILEMQGNRIAIDYNGDIRGIFTKKGKPLAFFRPDYHRSGYSSKAAELDAFKHGKNILFT